MFPDRIRLKTGPFSWSGQIDIDHFLYPAGPGCEQIKKGANLQTY